MEVIKNDNDDDGYLCPGCGATIDFFDLATDKFVCDACGWDSDNLTQEETMSSDLADAVEEKVDTDMVSDAKKFVELTKQKRDLEAQKREVNAELEQVEQRLVDEMINTGMQNMTIDDMNLYIQNRVYVRSKDHAALARAMLDLGWDEYMVTSPSKLKSEVKTEDDFNDLHPSIREHLDWHIQPRVNARKS